MTSASGKNGDRGPQPPRLGMEMPATTAAQAESSNAPGHSCTRYEPPFRLSRASKDIAFGSLAGMVSKVFEHPFDLVKVRLQTQPSTRPSMYAGAIDCFRQTYVKEGFRGLYRGLSMPVFGATLENATLFFTYNFVQGSLRNILGFNTSQQASTSSLQQDAEHPLPMRYLAVAAACAGASTSLVLTPVELIKCKMQVQMVAREVDVLAAEARQSASSTANGTAAAATTNGRHNALHARTGAQLAGKLGNAGTSGVRQISSQAFVGLDGPLTILRKILQTDGVRGLWLGQTGTLLRETGGGTAWFLTFEWASRKMLEAKAKQQNVTISSLTKKDLTSAQLIGAGALSGIGYNVVLFPADSVKSTMQTEREWAASSSSSTQPYKGRGFVATFVDIYKSRGLRGLYAGCGVTCMRSAPSSALIFLLYNKLETVADEWGI